MFRISLYLPVSPSHTRLGPISVRSMVLETALIVIRSDASYYHRIVLSIIWERKKNTVEQIANTRIHAAVCPNVRVHLIMTVSFYLLVYFKRETCSANKHSVNLGMNVENSFPFTETQRLKHNISSTILITIWISLSVMCRKFFEVKDMLTSVIGTIESNVIT